MRRLDRPHLEQIGLHTLEGSPAESKQSSLSLLIDGCSISAQASSRARFDMHFLKLKPGSFGAHRDSHKESLQQYDDKSKGKNADIVGFHFPCHGRWLASICLLNLWCDDCDLPFLLSSSPLLLVLQHSFCILLALTLLEHYDIPSMTCHS